MGGLGEDCKKPYIQQVGLYALTVREDAEFATPTTTRFGAAEDSSTGAEAR